MKTLIDRFMIFCIKLYLFLLFSTYQRSIYIIIFEVEQWMTMPIYKRAFIIKINLINL